MRRSTGARTKWFLDLNVDDEPFAATTFTKNRERLLEAEVARAFFAEAVAEAGRKRLLSDDHFSVDGTLLEAWASLKSYRPRDEQEPPSSSGGRNTEVDFRGRRRSRETHVSRTDAEARLYRKGNVHEAKLSYLGHVLSENRHGLVVDVELSEVNGYGEREAALQMLERSVRGRATLGADHCPGGWADLGWYGGESGFTASYGDAAHIVVEGKDIDGLVIRAAFAARRDVPGTMLLRATSSRQRYRRWLGWTASAEHLPHELRPRFECPA